MQTRRLFMPVIVLVLLLSVGRLARAEDEPGRWAFEPPRDEFRADALLDLRSLNEAVAGQSGFVRVGADGQFVLGNGQPVRFWSCDCDLGREKPWAPKPLSPTKTEPDLAHGARFLAKRGINMVRIGFDANPSPKQAATDINTAQRDWFWRVVAAMKKEGIYTTICPYWSVPTKFGKDWGIPGGSAQSALGLLFFDPTLQKDYKAWMKALYTEKNPYTGIPLSQDPSVAIIQIQNEDSLLFWTFGSIKGEQKKNLGKRFAEWTLKKYGTMDAALNKWGQQKIEGDDPAEGVLGFINIYEMTLPRKEGPRTVRLDDQTEFITETDHEFYRMMGDYLRKDLGCKPLLNACNWRTASPEFLSDCERWSYTPLPVDAINRYYTGLHTGKNNGWAIQPGDQFTSPSILLDPAPFPISLKQTAGRPILITESAWVLPNDHASEGPFLISAYSSLTGVASYYWFASGDDEWTQPQSANGYMPNSQRLWTFANPDMLGNFPAAALLFRKGYVKSGETVVNEQRSLEDLWQRRAPLISEEGGFDPNRDTGNLSPRSSVKTPVNPLAFLAGRVEVTFGGDPAKSKVVNLDKLIDDPNKTVHSITDEITLNYDKGFCTLNSPKAQGVTAFFKNQQSFPLKDVEITSGNDYGAVLVVAMDEQPLARSRKVLVQVGTQCRPTGWKQSPRQIPVKEGTFDGFVVDNVGHAPWQVVRADATILVKNRALTHATVLDMNGDAAGNVPLEKTPEGVRFKFPEAAMYVVLQ